MSALTAHHIAVDGWSREVTERLMRERLATQRASPTTDVIFMIVALCSSLFGLLRINNWMVGSFFASFRSILQTPHMAATASALLSLITFSVWNQTHGHGVFTSSKTTRKGGEEWRSRYIWSRDRDMHVSIASPLDDALYRQVEQCTPMVRNRFDLFSTDWTQDG